ncbi:DUF2306 domain-containing protein [Lysinibacillus piscis]|uniref:DUF2306 domain-containing protein n=1 Tax=Lysinibacillus piscis TaxID=2518931 RepID=A0ABQ5NKM7_9BACI|nr:DUF2306 domain-containing protein [Lysinibacillus sp. KH24]GLC88915.1 hypothetical protein LYSBPC_20420 [Lysinibacillus sp. KH24]
MKKHMGLWILGLFAVLIGIYAIVQYGIIGVEQSGFYQTKVNVYKEWLSSIWHPMLATHIVGGTIALVIGPLLFVKKIRATKLWLHQTIGYLYAGSIVLGGIAGGYVAFYATGGLVAQLGFFFLAICWLGTTGMAVYYAVKRQRSIHRQWAIRSYSLTFAAVTLRLWLPLCMVLFGEEAYPTYYAAIAWLCWVPNLLFAWVYTKRDNKK